MHETEAIMRMRSHHYSKTLWSSHLVRQRNQAGGKKHSVSKLNLVRINSAQFRISLERQDKTEIFSCGTCDSVPDTLGNGRGET